MWLHLLLFLIFQICWFYEIRWGGFSVNLYFLPFHIRTKFIYFTFLVFFFFFFLSKCIFSFPSWLQFWRSTLVRLCNFLAKSHMRCYNLAKISHLSVILIKSDHSNQITLKSQFFILLLKPSTQNLGHNSLFDT